MSHASGDEKVTTLQSDGTLSGGAVMPESLLRRQADLQQEFLKVSSDLFARWFRRRHGTVQAIAELTHATIAGARPDIVAAAWVHWYAGAAVRLSEDAADQAEALTTMTRFCTGGIGRGRNDLSSYDRVSVLREAESGATGVSGEG